MNTCDTCWMFETMLKCVSITPFGSPVLPLEKMIVANVSTADVPLASASTSGWEVVVLPARTFLNNAPGTSQARASAASFSPMRGEPKVSSRKSVRPGMTKLGKRSTKALDVMTTSSSHWPAQAAMISLDEV